MDPNQMPQIVIDLLTHSPAALAILYMLRHFGKFMTDQRDFFFGPDGYVTKRDKAMESAMTNLASSQVALASKLDGVCKFNTPGAVRRRVG